LWRSRRWRPPGRTSEFEPFDRHPFTFSYNFCDFPRPVCAGLVRREKCCRNQRSAWITHTQAANDALDALVLASAHALAVDSDAHVLLRHPEECLLPLTSYLARGCGRGSLAAGAADPAVTARTARERWNLGERISPSRKAAGSDPGALVLGEPDLHAPAFGPADPRVPGLGGAGSPRTGSWGDGSPRTGRRGDGSTRTRTGPTAADPRAPVHGSPGTFSSHPWPHGECRPI
jgi:hypothetical protein